MTRRPTFLRARPAGSRTPRSRAGDQGGVREPQGERQQPRRRAAGAADRRTVGRLHVSRSSRARSAAACRPVGCSPWPSASSSSGSARSMPSSRGSTGPARAPRDREERGVRGGAGQDRGEAARGRCGETAERHAGALKGLRPRVTSLHQDAEAESRAAVHESTLQQEASGSSAQPQAHDVDRAATVLRASRL